MTRWLLFALVACGNREAPAPSAGTASAEPPAPDAPADGWTALKRSPDQLELVRGTRRVAVAAGTHWFSVHGKELLEDPRVGSAIVQACGDGDRTLLLGRTPVVVCGEEHHERATRLDAGKLVEIEDPVAVATTVEGELWMYGSAPRTQLAATTNGDAVIRVPPFARLGALPDSTVRARLCADPPIADVAGDGASVAALVVECDPAAPIRIASWRSHVDKPEKLTTLDPKALGFVPERLAIAGAATVVAGVADGKAVVARVEATPAITRGDGPASHVVGLELAGGHAWTLAVGVAGKRDVWTLARDGVTQTTSFGEVRALGTDEKLGVVVVATSAAGWTVAAHPP